MIIHICDQSPFAKRAARSAFSTETNIRVSINWRNPDPWTSVARSLERANIGLLSTWSTQTWSKSNMDGPILSASRTCRATADPANALSTDRASSSSHRNGPSMSFLTTFISKCGAALPSRPPKQLIHGVRSATLRSRLCHWSRDESISRSEVHATKHFRVVSTIGRKAFDLHHDSIGKCRKISATPWASKHGSGSTNPESSRSRPSGRSCSSTLIHAFGNSIGLGTPPVVKVLNARLKLFFRAVWLTRFSRLPSLLIRGQPSSFEQRVDDLVPDLGAVTPARV